MQFASRRSTVMARNGMVATSQPLAAMAGLRMLMAGGNAVDAAVAAAAALNVVEPHSTGVGGDVFALVWMAEEGKVHALNASGRAPGAASLDDLRARGITSIAVQSPYAVTVPGAVSGWEAALDSYGTMPLSEVLKPAIGYASDGYPVSETISSHWESNVHKLKAHRSGDELLLDGRAPGPGEIMHLPELARTLHTIAEGGSEAFYAGQPARSITDFVQRLGGWLSMDDMANHSATWVEPISTEYRGVRCWECPPNSQGVNVLLALNLAEGFDIEAMGLQSAAAYHHLIECMRLSLADGLSHITDPRRMRVPVDELVSKTYANGRRRLILQDRAMASAPAGPTLSHADTVYISCVDGHGNACSFINSVYTGFGTGLVAPGTGIALQNRGTSFSLDPGHPNALEPNKRPYHTLIPGMATRDGRLWLCYGVMGGAQQAQGHFQVLANMIDFGLGPQAALDAPRFSVRVGEGVAIESAASPAIPRDLAAMGHDIMVLRPHGVFFGGGQIIERNAETGVLKAGSEPRLDGCAVGW
jgi:gamma-glutamyltranspeptidase/glutathione hydrolase